MNEWKLWYDPYQPYQAENPRNHDTVEIKRLGSDKTDFIRPADLSPYFNVANLYWRPLPDLPVIDVLPTSNKEI